MTEANDIETCFQQRRQVAGTVQPTFKSCVRVGVSKRQHLAYVPNTFTLPASAVPVQSTLPLVELHRPNESIASSTLLRLAVCVVPLQASSGEKIGVILSRSAEARVKGPLGRHAVVDRQHLLWRGAENQDGN